MTSPEDLKPRLTGDSNEPGLIEDERGVVFVEYLTLATMVTIIGASAVFLLGLPMVRLYEWGSMMVTVPIP